MFSTGGISARRLARTSILKLRPSLAIRPQSYYNNRSTDKHLSSLPLMIQDFFSGKKAPKGFGNFYPKEKGKEGDDSSKDSKKEFKFSLGGEPKKDGNNGGDQEPKFGPSQMLTTALALFLLYSMISNNSEGGAGKEINWQEFKTHLLAAGDVERVVVVNKQIAKVYLKRPESTQFSEDGAHREQLHSSSEDIDKYDNQAAPASGYMNRLNPSSASAPYYFNIGSIESFERKLELAQRELGIASRHFVPVQYINETNWMSEGAKLAPTLLIIAAWLFMMRNMGGSGGGGGMSNIFKIGKSNATMHGKGDKSMNVTFKDVAGCDEAKMEIMEFVEFLKNPERFTRVGAKIPKGALLCGPPGTGKTLLAKATAGEASVPFFSISGSDFIEMFVGVGPSRVRDLFAQARKNAPCIVFIDEIDAVARQRGKGGFSGGNDERENTLNQLLVEMDGFATKEGVVVLAGTNRIDILDQAILRPGRFDRQIKVDLPDIRGRKQIFDIYLKKLNVHGDKNEVAQRLAALTPGFAGAQIANICNEAAILAARKERDDIDMACFEGAVDRVIGGLEKKNSVMTKEELRTVAYHEAGHAIMGWYLEHADPLLKVTIIPRMSGALGFAQYLPKEMALHTTEQIKDRMAMALGGRAAEELTFGVITTGASDDLDKVTKMAYSMVKIFGMNARVGNVSFPPQEGAMIPERLYSETTAQIIDEEVNKIVLEAYNRTKEMLSEHKDAVALVAEKLLAKETITQHDIAALIGARPFPMPQSYAEFITAADNNKFHKDEEEDTPIGPEPVLV